MAHVTGPPRLVTGKRVTLSDYGNTAGRPDGAWEVDADGTSRQVPAVVPDDVRSLRLHVRTEQEGSGPDPTEHWDARFGLFRYLGDVRGRPVLRELWWVDWRHANRGPHDLGFTSRGALPHVRDGLGAGTYLWRVVHTTDSGERLEAELWFHVNPDPDPQEGEA